MRSPEDLLNHSTTQQDQQYIPSHHHEAAGGEIVNNPGFTGIDYETVAGDSTMADAVYHHQSVQAYSNVADGQVMAASHENVTAEDVLEAAMEGYDTNNDKRPMEDIEGDEDPNKRIRTSEILFTASKKVNNEQWESMFERLKDYKTLNGDCLVPKRYTIDPKLGTWVETQRVQYKRLPRATDQTTGQEIVQPNKRLNTERLQKLESIGFAWSAKQVRKNQKKAEPAQTAASAGNNASTEQQQQQRRQRMREALWEDMYQRLVQFKERHGNCLVPRKYESDPKLASWVESQRVLWNRDLRKQDTSKLSEGTTEQINPNEQQKPLEAIPLGTNNELGNDDAKVKHLTPERKSKLDQIGFVWSLRSKRIEDHWDDMFQQLEEYKALHGDCLVPSRYEENLKLGKWVETQRYEYTKLQRAVAGNNVSKGDSSDGLSNNADAPTAATTVENIKARPSSPRLTEVRLKRLESIGFEWKVKHKMKRYYDKQWGQMFRRLLDYKEANGHCMVPKRYPPDVKLGTWVHTQRIQYRKLIAGRKGGPAAEPGSDSNSESKEDNDGVPVIKPEEEVTYRLTEERRKRLEEVGFVWSAREGEKGNEASRITRNSYDDQWDSMFEKLKEYKEKFGHCLVPKRFKDNPKLGTWVDTQRVQFKKLKKKLASQGKTYEVGKDQAVIEQQQSGAASQVTTPSVVSPKPLVGRLTDERIRRLQNLGFVWSLRDDWQKHYEELKAYQREHVHCNVPARYNANRRLGIWVSAQRQQYKLMQQTPDSAKPRRSAPLTKERIALLNDIGFTWTIRSRDSLGESWNQRLIALKEFKARHGHCLVPSRYSPNPELGIWVGTQRTQYRLFMRGKETGTPVSGATAMNEERIRELEELGFVWALRGGEGRRDEAPMADMMYAAGAISTAAAMEPENAMI